jgi:hypothetical protein
MFPPSIVNVMAEGPVNNLGMIDKVDFQVHLGSANVGGGRRRFDLRLPAWLCLAS